jgi:hypothetical protein
MTPRLLQSTDAGRLSVTMGMLMLRPCAIGMLWMHRTRQNTKHNKVDRRLASSVFEHLENESCFMVAMLNF